MRGRAAAVGLVLAVLATEGCRTTVDKSELAISNTVYRPPDRTEYEDRAWAEPPRREVEFGPQYRSVDADYHWNPATRTWICSNCHLPAVAAHNPPTEYTAQQIAPPADYEMEAYEERKAKFQDPNWAKSEQFGRSDHSGRWVEPSRTGAFPYAGSAAVRNAQPVGYSTAPNRLHRPAPASDPYGGADDGGEGGDGH